MFWHIDTDVISLIVIAAVYIYYTRAQMRDSRPARSFAWCLRTGIVVTVIDIAASIVMEAPVSRFVYHLFMTLYLVLIEEVIVSWYFYTLSILYYDDERRRKVAAWIGSIPYAAYALLVCTNPWNGLFYTLGPDLAYERGPLFFLMLAVYALYSIAIFLLVYIRRRHIPQNRSAAILLSLPLILAVSIAVQLMLPGWLMILPGYMISLVLAFLFLQTRHTRESQTLMESLSLAAMCDQLTGLYNRTGLENRVRASLSAACGKKCLAAIVDVDDLKLCNDTLGHSEGDRALRAVAAQLKAHFRASDTVARFGGDEFVVYLVGELNEMQARRSFKSLVEEVAALCVNEGFPLHISAGVAFGVVGRDDFYRLCARADMALYHVKRGGKNGYAFYDPAMEPTSFYEDLFLGAPAEVPEA